MHFDNLYKKKYPINSINFNKKLNWFFDIKYIIFRKLEDKTIKDQAIQLSNDYRVLINKRKKIKKNNYKITKKIKTIKIKKNNFLRNNKSRKKALDAINFLKKNNLDEYFRHFLLQGSISNNDFIEGWSDLDSFVVIKDETLLNYKKILVVQKLLKKFYKLVLKFSSFQHHGIITFSEFDLINYKNGFLPPEALKENINIFRNEYIIFKREYNQKKNISLEILKQRCNYMKRGINDGCFDHHVFNNIKMCIPLKENDPTLHQLFCHIGFMINLPILFLDSIGKSSHKKNSFEKFYKIIKDKKTTLFIKNHEELRIKWKKVITNKKRINKNIINFLGKDYMTNCYNITKYVIKKASINSNTN